MKLGPIQQKWVDTLRAYPERQLAGRLGEKQGEETKLCCLGQAMLILEEQGLTKVCWAENLTLTSENGETTGTLTIKDRDNLGLKQVAGSFLTEGTNRHVPISYDGEIYNTSSQNTATSLAELNDAGASWPKIADIIEKHANLLFTHPV